VSRYKINLFLEDSNVICKNSLAYSVNFEIRNAKIGSKETLKNSSQSNSFSGLMQNISSENVDFNAKVPYWKFMSISNEGKVQIKFSEELIIPANAALNVNKTVLKL
jgi:hypothetical protein